MPRYLAMLEVVLVVALVIGACRALRLRLRPAIVGALAALYLVAADTANVVASPFRDLHPLHAFIFTFLGPSMWHHRGDGVLPLPPPLHEAFLLRGARVLLSASIAWYCTREAGRTNPLLPRNRALQWLATPFVGAAVLDSLEGLIALAARYVASV